MVYYQYKRRVADFFCWKSQKDLTNMWFFRVFGGITTVCDAIRYLVILSDAAFSSKNGWVVLVSAWEEDLVRYRHRYVCGSVHGFNSKCSINCGTWRLLLRSKRCFHTGGKLVYLPKPHWRQGPKPGFVSVWIPLLQFGTPSLPAPAMSFRQHRANHAIGCQLCQPQQTVLWGCWIAGRAMGALRQRHIIRTGHQVALLFGHHRSEP